MATGMPQHKFNSSSDGRDIASGIVVSYPHWFSKHTGLWTPGRTDVAQISL